MVPAILAYRKGYGKGASLRGEWRLENAAARVTVAWQSSDLELNITRPSGHLITGFPRLQCPNWVLQLLPDLPALLSRANLACAISRTHRRLAYHCSAQKPKPFLGTIESGPGTSLRQLLELQAGIWSPGETGWEVMTVTQARDRQQ